MTAEMHEPRAIHQAIIIGLLHAVKFLQATRCTHILISHKSPAGDSPTYPIKFFYRERETQHRYELPQAMWLQDLSAEGMNASEDEVADG